MVFQIHLIIIKQLLEMQLGRGAVQDKTPDIGEERPDLVSEAFKGPKITLTTPALPNFMEGVGAPSFQILFPGTIPYPLHLFLYFSSFPATGIV